MQVTSGTVTAATTYTSTVTADATAITVGQCASAQGETDDGGQMTATSLALSPAGDDGCTPAGFGGMGTGMGRGPAGNAASNG